MKSSNNNLSQPLCLSPTCKKSYNLHRLTKRLSSQHPAILPDHGPPGVPLAGVLDEGVALVHGAAQHPAILGEDALHIWLLHHCCVQVADKHPWVDGLWVCLVGHITGLDLQRHAGWTGWGSDWQMDGLGGRDAERRGSEMNKREQITSVSQTR